MRTLLKGNQMKQKQTHAVAKLAIPFGCSTKQMRRALNKTMNLTAHNSIQLYISFSP